VDKPLNTSISMPSRRTCWVYFLYIAKQMSQGGEIIKRSLVAAVVVVCVVLVAAAAYFALRGPSFSISVSPNILTIPRGENENVTISYAPRVPYNLSTGFSAGAAGINVSATAPPYTFTITVSSDAIPGQYTVTVEAVDQNTGERATTTFTVVVA
jgi:hypothetical protein